MPKRDYHVVPRNKQWAIQKEGKDRASSLHRTQKDASNEGRRLAKKNQTALVIHRCDGRIRDSHSYENNPHPPKDRKH
ncbi:conserved hypothetical protein (plasmid) [Nitrosococcus oceani ATCC 19707]|uniref:DUF2188 domain-containing protein n=2 Tax=Nitrosococcus oceani TaxID=1229 RepID=Q3JF59_NITOC|nr:DUF2188 domain-containing protein [Nitrosococcus oceani]ABA56537.1 conserved hypothetical protein [Nitrosococcus oceani ATCC 19707]EDZ65235.1 hypothetical protein NOC27_3399 [Nitrosococcus oceani AFC27]KFI17758.1 hypothetical protein IB75_18530 [Nitrosococcus oceani C-27]BBM60813.1 hypothetical protein NONS58_P0270 [Nitrosococcus oceani]